MPQTLITAEQFERAYAERSGLTVEQLRVYRTVRPCKNCDSELCEGWQSMSHDRAAEYDECQRTGEPFF